MLDSELTNNGIDDNDGAGRGGNGAASPDTGVDRKAESAHPAAVPAVLFQAPQVLFQPPQPAPAFGGGRFSAAPAPTAGSSGNGSGAEADDEEAESGAVGRVQARRPSRGTRGGRGSRDTARDRDRSPSDRSPSDRGPADEDAAAEADADGEAAALGADASAEDGDEGPARRRRRRSSRTRGRVDAAGIAEGAEADGEPADADAADDDALADDGGDAGLADGVGTSRRRRRKRRRGSAETDVSAPDDPPDTVVHVREPHNLADDVRAVKGSTRLEAKKQRRREGRESGRRRPPVITESEFLARRESVERTMVVRQRGDRTQIAVLEDGVLVEHYVNRTTHQSYVGNVYLGKVQNVLPSMEAAFVDIGKGRNAVLYAGEVNFEASGLEGQPKRIESALKAGQSVIVQVTKDPVGHKGARLTSQISLPGRYLVYVPGASMTGISRKLPDTERNRLKHILKKVTPDNAGVIVRTAAEGAAEAELERDVTRLAAQWENIEKKGKTATAPALLYGEPDLTIRVVRDVFNEDFSTLMVSGEVGWEVIDEYVKYVAPHLADRLVRWGPEAEAAEQGLTASGEDVFAAYRIDEQLAKALERKVWLPSGGSLIIDRTEAMTVIDVNTGKFTGQGGNLEETVTRNNLEAAEEIVRQLRLRDVGGIVVIDFIDMVLEANRELVLRRLLECLARDRTKHQVAEVTSLGLVQMTRKRVGAGLLEAFSEPCDSCNGRGVLVHFEPTEPGQHSSRRGGPDYDAHPRGGRPGNGNAGNGQGAAGNGSASSAQAGAPGAPGASGPGGEAGIGQSSHGGRRNRRDRNSRHGGAATGAPAAVTHAIAGVASATLPAPAASLADDARSAGAAAVADPVDYAETSGGFAGKGPVSLAGPAPEIAVPAAPVPEAPIAEVPPAAPGRRTRAGSAMVRRIATSDEPVAVIVPVPPIAAPEAAAKAEPAAEAELVSGPEAVAEPVAEPEPVAEVEPVAAAGPAAEAELVSGPEAVAEPEPVAEPAAEADGALFTQPEAAAEPEPVAEPVPAAEAEPAAEGMLFTQSELTAEPAVIEESAPAVEPMVTAEAEPVTAEREPAEAESAESGATPAEGEPVAAVVPDVELAVGERTAQEAALPEPAVDREIAPAEDVESSVVSEPADFPFASEVPEG
jgi:ribonuclease E